MTVASEMIERVRTAIMTDLGDRGGVLGGIDDETLAEMGDTLARAAIEAITKIDLSDHACLAGARALRDTISDTNQIARARAVFVAMLAALKPGEQG